MAARRGTSDTGRWVTIIRMTDRIVQHAFKERTDADELAAEREDMPGVTKVTVDFVRDFSKRPRVTTIWNV